MESILIGLAAIFVGYLVFQFVGAILNYGVRKPLAEFCMKHGQSASPWAILLWEAFWGSELFTGTISSFFLEHSIAEGFWTLSFYPWIVMAMAALPFVILLCKARLYFLPVLFIKILCIPLDIVYVLTGGSKDPDNIPQGSSAYTGGGGSTYDSRTRQRTGGSSHFRSGNFQSSGCDYSSQPYSEESSAGMSSHIAEKYSDQNRVQQESDGSYSTAKIGGETAYFNGEYAPFNESGGDVEIRTYDSDYAPMD